MTAKTRNDHACRYSSMDAHVECTCGWRDQALHRADGMMRIEAHMRTSGQIKTSAPKYRKLPRVDRGIDHGAERTLIAEGPTGRRVWWTPGHTGWSGVGQSSYFPGELCYAAEHQALGRRIVSGGRMAIHVKRLQSQIDDFVSGRVDTINPMG